MPPSRVGMRGDILIAVVPAGTVSTDGPGPLIRDLRTSQIIRLIQTHNLESNYTLEAIAKSLSGEAGKIGDTGVSITPKSMAIGNSVADVSADMTALESEVLRKDVTITRMGTKVLYKVTLNAGEALGNIGSLALFGDDTDTGSQSTGSLEIGGTPAGGDSITVAFNGRAVSPYWVSGTDTGAVAAGLAAWLNADGDFGSLFTAIAAGSTVSIVSGGMGTVYNGTLGASTTGGVTCGAAGATGGATPGGTLLAAANATFRKERNTQLLVEWTISVTN